MDIVRIIRTWLLPLLILFILGALIVGYGLYNGIQGEVVARTQTATAVTSTAIRQVTVDHITSEAIAGQTLTPAYLTSIPTQTAEARTQEYLAPLSTQTRTIMNLTITAEWVALFTDTPRPTRTPTLTPTTTPTTTPTLIPTITPTPFRCQITIDRDGVMAYGVPSDIIEPVLALSFGQVVDLAGYSQDANWVLILDVNQYLWLKASTLPELPSTCSLVPTESIGKLVFESRGNPYAKIHVSDDFTSLDTVNWRILGGNELKWTQASNGRGALLNDSLARTTEFTYLPQEGTDIASFTAIFEFQLNAGALNSYFGIQLDRSSASDNYYEIRFLRDQCKVQIVRLSSNGGERDYANQPIGGNCNSNNDVLTHIELNYNEDNGVVEIIRDGASRFETRIEPIEGGNIRFINHNGELRLYQMIVGN